MRRDLGLVLQGLWFRRWVSLAVLVVASFVVGAAVTGPLFLPAARESVLRDTLAQALTSGRGVSDRFAGPLAGGPVGLVQAQDTAKLGARPTLARDLGPPVTSLEVSVDAGTSGATPAGVELVWRDGFCAHVRLVEGTCADRPETVLVSTTTAVIEGWSVGSTLMLDGGPAEIAGTYLPLDPLGDYWAGTAYFAAYPADSPRLDPSSLDAVFATRATVESQGPDSPSRAVVSRQLDLDRIRVADVPALQQELADWTAIDGSGVLGDTAIPVVLLQATAVVEALALPVAVVEVQLLVLCFLVLFLVVANAAEARGPEVALAKLRGVGPGATVAFGLLDTLLLVLVAVPLGFLLAWAWTVGLVRWQLAPGVPVVLTPAASWAAAGAGAGAVVAAALATAGTLRRPVVEQWRRATRRVRARSWVVDTAVAVVAVVALVALLDRDPGAAQAVGPLALAAPGLVILVAALVGSRVLPALCRAAYEPTRRRGWVAGLLAVRQLGRRPGTLRLALLLTVAFGLVVFGVDAWSVARGNAHDRAWTEVGAAEVLTVSVPPGVDLGGVVDRIDPSGGQVAAVSTATDYTQLPSVLLMAVQPERYARVAFWRDDLGPAPLADLAHRLAVPAAAPVLLSGDRLRVDVDARTLEAKEAPVLVADVVQPSALGGSTPVVLGPVGSGRHTLEAPLPCPATTCRLAGVELRRPGSAFFAYHGTFVLTGLQTHGSSGWQDSPGAVTTAGGWRPQPAGAGAATSSADGTVLQVDAGLTDTPTWQVADHPAPLPALVGAAVSDEGRASNAGLGGRRLALDPVVVAAALPAGGDRATVVDRTAALRASEGGVTRDVETVWVSRVVIDRISPQLDAAGVTVLDTSSAAALTRVYGRQGPGLALLLFLAGASLAALLAGGGAALTLHLNGRRRTYELAAMLALGLRRRTLLASLYLEQGLLVLFGVVVGTVAGLGAAVLALPVIPEFSDAPTAPPLRYDLQVGPVAVSLAAAVLVLAVTIAVSSASLVRSAHVDQLREAPA